MNNAKLRLLLWFRVLSIKTHTRSRQFRGMKWSNRPRPRIGWGVCIRLNSPPVFFRTMFYQQMVNIFKNSNLGSFLKYWKGQKREPGLI